MSLSKGLWCISTGFFIFFFSYLRLPNPPYTPGCDASGIVEAVGSGVHTLKVGQRVFVTGRNLGSYAEYIVSEAAYVFPLHERLSFAQGISNVKRETAFF